MGQLHAGNGSLFANEFDDGPPRFHMAIEIHAGIGGRNPAASLPRSSLRENERRTSHGTAPQVYEVPGLRMTVHRRVIAHGRNAESVFQIDFPQSKRGESRGHCKNPSINGSPEAP